MQPLAQVMVRIAVCLAGALLILHGAGKASACSLDGIASMSVNGTPAELTGGAPTAGTVLTWAPFTLLAAAPGATLRLSEDLQKLRNVLPDGALRAPFRWSFGDGTAVQGQSVTHRYRRTGWHLIAVSYYWSARHRWIPFDRARLLIVPAGAVWRANLSYRIDVIVVAVANALYWIAAVNVAGLGIWLFWRRTGGWRR